MPGSSSGPHQAPPNPPGFQNSPSGAFSSGAHATPVFGEPPPQDPNGNGLPPTMAIPVINPLDMAPPPGPGVSSGPRPGATTNMVWATPPSASPEEAPPARKPRTMIFAAAAAGVLVLGGIAFAAFSGGAPPPPAPAPHVTRPTPTAQNTPPVQPVAQPVAPTMADAQVAAVTPDAQATQPETADAGTTEPAIAQTDDAGSTEPLVAQNTPPVAQPEPQQDPARNGRRRPRDRGQQPGDTTQGRPTQHTHTRQTGHSRDPLGY